MLMYILVNLFIAKFENMLFYKIKLTLCLLSKFCVHLVKMSYISIAVLWCLLLSQLATMVSSALKIAYFVVSIVLTVSYHGQF